MGLNKILNIWQIQKGVYLKLYDGITYTLREINRGYLSLDIFWRAKRL